MSVTHVCLLAVLSFLLSTHSVDCAVPLLLSFQSVNTELCNALFLPFTTLIVPFFFSSPRYLCPFDGPFTALNVPISDGTLPFLKTWAEQCMCYNCVAKDNFPIMMFEMGNNLVFYYYLVLKKKGSFYIAQYPVRWTAQSALHLLPSLTDLFIPTPFSASPGSILAMQQLCATTKSLTFPPHSIARYSFIQMSRQGRKCREGKCPIFQTVAKGDSNPGSLDCESGILPLSYRAPHYYIVLIYPTSHSSHSQNRAVLCQINHTLI